MIYKFIISFYRIPFYNYLYKISIRYLRYIYIYNKIKIEEKKIKNECYTVENERGPKVSMGGIEVTKMTQQMSIRGERTQAEVQRRVHSGRRGRRTVVIPVARRDESRGVSQTAIFLTLRRRYLCHQVSAYNLLRPRYASPDRHNFAPFWRAPDNWRPLSFSLPLLLLTCPLTWSKAWPCKCISRTGIALSNSSKNIARFSIFILSAWIILLF